MEPFQIDQILREHPKGRLDFSYCKGRYALMLLNWAVNDGLRASDHRITGDDGIPSDEKSVGHTPAVSDGSTANTRGSRGGGKSVHELKASRFAPLLDKPIVRRAIARTGGVVHPGVLESAAFDPSIVPAGELDTYRITFGLWGHKNHEHWDARWHQTTRPGQNIVLQLNFTRRHNRAYYAMLQPTDHHLFMMDAHPNADDLLTLAWARIDVALENGEALIEEVQSDWVSIAEWFVAHLASHDTPADDAACAWMRSSFAPGITADDVRGYVKTVLRPYAKTWSEATLSAALWFLRDWVGVRRIFFNTFDGGNWLKRIGDGRAPPRWIYSTLPKRFCFEQTASPPRALALSRNPEVRARLRRPGLSWFLLEL